MLPREPDTGARPVGDTAPPELSLSRLRRARAMRRGFIGLLTLVVILGAAGFLGVRSSTVSASSGGLDLTVTYPGLTRSGLASPWAVEVHRESGFDGRITIATTGEYFELFDENAFHPTPDAASSDGERLLLTFEPPPGDTLRVAYDARISPAVQLPRDATTEVIVDGQPLVAVSYRTWVMP